MKVISLNTWGGRGGIDELLAFFREHSDVDIFCLQEVWNGGEEMVGAIGGGVPLVGVDTDLLNKIAAQLPEHEVRFSPIFRGYYGLAMLVRTSIPILEEQQVYVYKEAGWESEEDLGDHARSIQALRFDTSNGERMVVNYHGLWRKGQNKNDIPDRLLQSDNIMGFLAGSPPHVLIGDLNLLPETESLARLEVGHRNLVKEYGVTSTRTSHYTKPERFADYALVSDGIEVMDFKVLPDEVSDHSPLYLEFE